MRKYRVYKDIIIKKNEEKKSVTCFLLLAGCMIDITCRLSNAYHWNVYLYILEMPNFSIVILYILDTFTDCVFLVMYLAYYAMN